MKTLWYVGRPNALANFNWPKRQDLDNILAKNKKIKLTGFKFKHDLAIQYFQLMFTEDEFSGVAETEKSKSLEQKVVKFDPTKTVRKIEFAVSGEQKNIRGLRLLDDKNELLVESIWSDQTPDKADWQS